MNYVTYLVASLALAATGCLAATDLYGELSHDDELCLEMNRKQAICDILIREAEKGDQWASEFSSVGQRVCKQAEKLNETLMEYLESKKITRPNKCSYIRQAQGYNMGTKKAAKMIAHIQRGSPDYKKLHQADQLKKASKWFDIRKSFGWMKRT